jgi:UDP-N-acetylmuramyl tripeptide synthase
MVAAKFGGQLLGATMGEVGDKAAADANGFFRRGGDRDRTKRLRMMRVACQFSGRVFVTADNHAMKVWKQFLRT